MPNAQVRSSTPSPALAPPATGDRKRSVISACNKMATTRPLTTEELISNVQSKIVKGAHLINLITSIMAT